MLLTIQSPCAPAQGVKSFVVAIVEGQVFPVQQSYVAGETFCVALFNFQHSLYYQTHAWVT